MPLTTRRFDRLTDLEIAMLTKAVEFGSVWFEAGNRLTAHRDAVHALQRLGYLWPTTKGRPNSLNGKTAAGWKIEPEGLAAFKEAVRRIAA